MLKWCKIRTYKKYGHWNNQIIQEVWSLRLVIKEWWARLTQSDESKQTIHDSEELVSEDWHGYYRTTDVSIRKSFDNIVAVLLESVEKLWQYCGSVTRKCYEMCYCVLESAMRCVLLCSRKCYEMCFIVMLSSTDEIIPIGKDVVRRKWMSWPIRT